MKVADCEISGLLTSAYVDGGFTTSDKASVLFAPSAVRGRGHLLCARPQGGDKLAGMVIVVTPDSPARRLANMDEAELHLLAVADAYRGQGLGRVLVSAAISAAHEFGFQKMILWTQPTMTAAQGLYESTGFIRAAHRDPTINGLRFLAYEFNTPSREDARQ
ncbi:MAG: GNAT family N-acetyltransferase [Sideroxydans sp.]|nr:GNAT family N-acetyltransferase [Sideroxydans sp.]